MCDGRRARPIRVSRERDDDTARERHALAVSRAAFGFGLSVGSGVLVQYLFVREGVGANLPVAAGALLATAWLVRDGQNRVDLRDAWCGAAALVFGVLCAVRTDVPLVAFDLVATLAFALAAIVSLRGVVISALPLADLVTAVARTVGSIMTSGGRVIGTGAPSLITTMSSRSARATGHLAGATLAIPFLLL